MPQLIQKGKQGWDKTVAGGARVSCRACGVNNFIPSSDIYADGLVLHRFNCISGCCSYEDYIKLEGWNGRPASD